jgi:poly(3-hydroxyalkanoate) synthetase
MEVVDMTGEESVERLSPNELLNIIGTTPADNEEGFQVAIPWKSKIVGQQVRMLFKYHEMLKMVAGHPSVFGPLSLLAGWHSVWCETFLTGPIKASARISVHAGRNPDPFGEMNGWIYTTYARLMYHVTGLFIRDGKFDRKKAQLVSSTAKGKALLKSFMEEFSFLERSYNSLGLTRLKAMKDLLKCLLILITEKLIEGEPPPYVPEEEYAAGSFDFSKYQEDNCTRFENLYRENAFDSKEFSEITTRGKIGYSPYEIVEGSKWNSVTLRHYLLPEGVSSNGKVLYLATPLINKPEIFDFDKGRSVIEAMLKQGYAVYLVDHGDAGPEDADSGLDFYAKTIPDFYLDLIKQRHPDQQIYMMAYCMAGTLMLPYLARRGEELYYQGKTMDVQKIALMASPILFDDAESGHAPMREVIRKSYDTLLMTELFGKVNLPPHAVEAGMNEIQEGVQYTMAHRFYERAHCYKDMQDAAPFLFWLTHGTKFPARAHREWIEKFFMGNQSVRGEFRLPSRVPELDGKPVDMDFLRRMGVRIFSYKGTRDPIAPPGSCIASEIWGQTEEGNIGVARGDMNRTIEKNVGHIFVVSRHLLAEYMQIVSAFFDGGEIPV